MRGRGKGTEGRGGRGAAWSWRRDTGLHPAEGDLGHGVLAWHGRHPPWPIHPTVSLAQVLERNPPTSRWVSVYLPCFSLFFFPSVSFHLRFSVPLLPPHLCLCCRLFH